MTKHVVTGSCTTQITMFTKESGRTIKLMGGGSIHMLMGLNIMESGKMINNMDLERKVGQMELSMKDSTMKARKTEKGNSSLQMAAFTKESFK